MAADAMHAMLACPSGILSCVMCVALQLEEAMSQQLDDHIVMLQSMAFSPYKKPFEDRLAKWDAALNLVRMQCRSATILLAGLHLARVSEATAFKLVVGLEPCIITPLHHRKIQVLHRANGVRYVLPAVAWESDGDP